VKNGNAAKLALRLTVSKPTAIGVFTDVMRSNPKTAKVTVDLEVDPSSKNFRGFSSRKFFAFYPFRLISRTGECSGI